jgi:hypothetical protein
MTRIDVPNLVKFDFISYVQFIAHPAPGVSPVRLTERRFVNE